MENVLTLKYSIRNSNNFLLSLLLFLRSKYIFRIIWPKCLQLYGGFQFIFARLFQERKCYLDVFANVHATFTLGSLIVSKVIASRTFSYRLRNFITYFLEQVLLRCYKSDLITFLCSACVWGTVLPLAMSFKWHI